MRCFIWLHNYNLGVQRQLYMKVFCFSSLSHYQPLTNLLPIHSLRDWFVVLQLAILSYCSQAFALDGFGEIFPLWAATSRSLGGLGFSLHQIGIAMAIVGVVLLPFSMFLYAGVS